MNKNKLLKIKKCAIEIRRKFETNKVNKKLLKSLYQKYNPLDDVNSFVEKAQELFPKLNCGLTTLYLKNKLGHGKIINGRYKKNNHTFLLLPKNILVDITADQYSGPKVYVGEVKKPWVVNS